MDTDQLPAFTEHGLLPEGVHACTMEEVQRVFGRFQRSDRRQMLFSRLQEYFVELAKAGWDFELVVNGSFVMPRVDEPDDIDIILVMPPDWNVAAEVRPFEYNLRSSRAVRKRWGFDLFVARAGTRELASLIAYFIQVSPKWSESLRLPLGLRKGIVRVLR